ncbi:hypothetical protein [Micromonospora zhanjiangensis]
MDSEGVLVVPDERVIRDELQRLVLADLLGPLGGPDEEIANREDPLTATSSAGWRPTT